MKFHCELKCLVIMMLARFSSCDLEAETIDDNRVVNGTDALPGQIPYQVSLRLKSSDRHFCGGSIIEKRWILTAAHCLPSGTEYYVMVGSVTLDGIGNIKYNSKISVLHPFYDSKTFKNDLALIKTQETMNINTDNVKKILLNVFPIPDGAPITASGWGFQSSPGVPPNNLKILNTKSLSNEACATRWSPNNIYSSNLCTFTAVGEGLCFGDSGGPVVHKNRLAGVVSWVNPCAVGFPDVHTRVSSHIFWIGLTIGINVFQ